MKNRTASFTVCLLENREERKEEKQGETLDYDKNSRCFISVISRKVCHSGSSGRYTGHS